MKLVIILGAQAVGKMTVGQELVKITDLHLFHNHIMFEVILAHFGKHFGNVTDRLKDIIFEEYAKSDNYGLIYTACLSFDHQSDWGFLYHLIGVFKEVTAEVYVVELIASQEIRMQRNKTENRLLHKASKRNIDKSNENLIEADIRGRFVSNDGEIPFENYVKIDNSNLSPSVVATMIKDKFSL
ncbi:MAG: AAA family ATPase [Defluviitaleaceae bacterium]|nr:AAA family ATPase [Defluviitaleaceae bacterium]